MQIDCARLCMKHTLVTISIGQLRNFSFAFFVTSTNISMKDEILLLSVIFKNHFDAFYITDKIISVG